MTRPTATTALVAALLAALMLSSTTDAGSLSATPMKIDWQMVDNTTIMINVSCACTGWASVGWGKPGPAHAGMDVIQGTVSSTGSATLLDGTSSSYSAPASDAQQDYTVVASTYTSTSMFYSFTRKISTGDTASDVVIADGLYLFYAYTSTATSFSTKHDSKGSAGVNFVTPCSAPATLVNPDGATFQNCIQVDSTRNTRLRWNIVGQTVQAQLEGNVLGSAFAYTVGIRPKKYTGFPANSHPSMNSASDDYVDCWTAGLGGTCGSTSYCIKDGYLVGFSTGGDNSQFTGTSSVGNSSFMKYQFSRAFAAVDSKDQTIDLTTDWWLMYSYKTGTGPQTKPGEHSSQTGFQYVINFGQNYTCSSDWIPGVCNTTTVASGGTGGGTNGGSNSNSATGNSYSSAGMTVTWTPNTADKAVSFQFTYPGTGWGGLGFNAGSGAVHSGTEMFIFYQSSAGSWKIQSTWSTSKSAPSPNPSDAYVVAGTASGGNTVVTFARPYAGGAGTTYTIPDAATMVSLAYGGTAATYPASVSDCNYHGGNRDYFNVNLISGGFSTVKKTLDPGTIYVAIVLGFFGFYSVIRWTYKLFKVVTAKGTPIKQSAPSNEPQHKQFYRGSLAVPYKVKAGSTGGAGISFNQDGTPMNTNEQAPLTEEQKIEGFETHGGNIAVSVTAPQKKVHSAGANAIHGIWRARIPKTHIAVSDAVFAVLFIALNVYFTHIYKDVKYEQYVVWGYMCTANSLLVALPATRNSLLVWVLGVPFDVAITYHRWIGRVAIAQGIAHFITSIQYFATGLPKYNYGLGAVIAMMLLFLTSVAPLRRKTFNIFFAAHHVFIAFYVLGSYHSKVFYNYTLAAVAVYGFDRLLRIIWGVYPVKAQVKLLPGNVAKIIFPKHCLAHYEIGQYIFLNFPQIDMFEWHPFTLASGPGEKTNEVDIKALGNFTRKVLALAEVKGGTLWVRQDGPYGHWPFNYARYPNVMAISGGVGVTPCIALLRHIYHINRPNATLDTIVQNVFFVWSCKSEEEFGWFREEMNEIRKREGRDGYPRLHCYIHVTSNKGDKPLEDGLRSGRPNLPQVFGDVISEMEKDKANSRAFAVTCGPAAMVNESWDLATKHSIGNTRFDYHHETFEF